ncbi:hypothetical protein D3C76_1675220 [compost metagenome]
MAVNSRSSKTLSVMKAMPMPDVLLATPRSTNGELVLPPSLVPLPTPEAFQLPLFCIEPPQRTPRLLS